MRGATLVLSAAAFFYYSVRAVCAQDARLGSNEVNPRKGIRGIQEQPFQSSAKRELTVDSPAIKQHNENHALHTKTQQRGLENRVGNLFFTPKIINGVPAKEGDHPYFATRLSSGFICGAALVAPDILVTAAHCQNAFENDALVGALFRDRISNGARAVRIVEKIPHPEFLQSDFAVRNDIMVMKISPAVNDKELIRLNLDPNLPRVNEPLTAIGMGKLSDSNSDFPDRLMETQIFATTDERCRQSWGDITDQYICAFDESPLKTVCGGDSGSPLIDQNSGSVVGVVSFGAESCTSGEHPAAFTRISAYRNFLSTTICPRSANPPSNLGCSSNSDNSNNGGAAACRRANQSCNNSGQCCGKKLKCTGQRKCKKCAPKNKRCKKAADCCTKGAKCNKKKKCTK